MVRKRVQRTRSETSLDPEPKPPTSLVKMDAARRVEYALHVMSPPRGVPPRYSAGVAKISKECGVSIAQAKRDWNQAGLLLAERMQRDMPALCARIRDRMEAIARDAEEAGDRATASATYYRLGKLCGLGAMTEEEQAKRLSDAALTTAIQAALAMRVESMSTEELEGLLRRRREREAVDVEGVVRVEPAHVELASAEPASEGEP